MSLTKYHLPTSKTAIAPTELTVGEYIYYIVKYTIKL